MFCFLHLSALILAYQAGNISLCTALLQAGASLGIMNSEGDTVFSLNKKKCKSSTPGHVLSQLLGTFFSWNSYVLIIILLFKHFPLHYTFDSGDSIK